MTKRVWWVASYGDDGIEVSHYFTEEEYNEAMDELDEQHALGNYDTYTGSYLDV